MPNSQYRPDRGYAWVVVAACFVLSFLMPGLAMTSGQLYVALVDEYGVSKESASMPFTLKLGVRCLLGPIIGALGQRFGVRPIVLLGGIVSFIGGIVSAFAPNITWVTIGWGGLQGLGYALSHIIHFLMILLYFDKYKALATGLALSGDIAAAFIFPPLIQRLLLAYNIHGTFLILAAVSLNAVPAAMLLVPPPWEKLTQTKANKPRNSSKASDKEGLSNDDFEGDTLKKKNYLNSFKGEVLDPSKLQIAAKIIDDCHVNYEGRRVQEVCANCNLKSVEGQQDADIRNYTQNAIDFPLRCAEQHKESSLFQETWRTKSASYEMNAKNTPNLTNSAGFEKNSIALIEYKPFDFHHSTTIDLSKPDLTPSHDLKQKNRDSSLTNSQSQVREPSNPSADPKTGETTDPIGPKGKWLTILGQFFRVNKKPMFLVIGLSQGAWLVSFIAQFTVLIDFATDCGMTVEDGNHLVIAYALSDGAGRLLLGAVLDRRWLTVPQFAGLTTGLMGAFAFVLPFWPDLAFWMASFSISGFIQGGCCVMYPILVEQYMDKGEVSIAMGSLNLYGGLMMLPVPKVIGLFKDTMGTYDGVFWTTGGLCMFCGCLWLLEPCLLRLTSAKPSIPESCDHDWNEKNKI